MPLPLAIPVAIKGGELLIIGGVAATGAFMTWWYGAGGKEQTQQAAGALANSVSNSMSGADEEAGTKLETGAAADACTGDCPPPRECKELEDGMRQNANNIERRIQEMKLDQHNLYNNHYYGWQRHPDLGSWKGHERQIKQEQKSLENKRKESEKRNCPKPKSSILQWLRSNAPSAPAGG